jgi:hypothetical protein
MAHIQIFKKRTPRSTKKTFFMSEKEHFVKRKCTESPKQYADLVDSDSESGDGGDYQPHHSKAVKNASQACGEAMKASPLREVSRMFNNFSEIRPDDSFVGYDAYSRAVCVSFLGGGGQSKGAVEYCWIPLDALKNDARHNKTFLSEIEEYTQREDEKFWGNPRGYIEAADKEMWDLPRSSVTDWHSTTVKEPFLAMTLPSTEFPECVIFFKLSDRKTNGGTTYTSLKVLVESLMGGGKDTLARHLLKFAVNHANAIRHFIAEGDELKINKFFGFQVFLKDLTRNTLVPHVEPEKSGSFLQSLNPNYAIDVLRPVAEKYLNSKMGHDVKLLKQFMRTDLPRLAHDGKSYAGMVISLKTDTLFQGMLEKMEAAIDKVSSTNVKKTQSADVEAGIEASDAPFEYEDKKVDFSMDDDTQPSKKEAKNKKAEVERPGVMPMDMSPFELPEDLAGKVIKFFVSPSRTVVIGKTKRPNAEFDDLLMAATMISRDEQTKDNAPFALGGNSLPYKKRGRSAS